MAAKLARFSWLPGGLTAALVIVAGRLMSSTASAPLELRVYDHVVRTASVPPSRNVVLVTIDAASIEKIGPYPWPLDVHASLIDRLQADGARVVAFADAIVTSQQRGDDARIRAALALLESANARDSEQAQQLRRLLGEPANRNAEARFAQALANHGNVVLPVQVAAGSATSTVLRSETLATGSATAMANAPAMQVTHAPATRLVGAAGGLGHLHHELDPGGVLRTDVAAVRLDQGLLPSLATSVVARAEGLKTEQLRFETSHTLNIGKRAVPMEPGLRTRPHFFAADGERTFAHFSYWQVLGGEVPREQLMDKIVLIGSMDGTNAVTTPAGQISPLMVTASTVSGLLEDRQYTRTLLPELLEWLAALAVIIFAAFLLPHAPVLIGGIATALVTTILVVGEIGLLYSTQIWARFMLPSVALLVGFTIYLLGEFIRRANTKGGSAKDPTGNLRSLGQTFQKQGQLDLAFETYRRCPLDTPTMDLLYELGTDFERRRQMQKAEAVYSYMSARDPNYRDLRARRLRVKEAPPREATVSEVPKRAVPMPPRHPDSTDLEATVPARTLGRYEIERELGKGAMGVVYLGRDPKINRVVAIKAIPLAEEFEEEDLAEARARFFREAEMAGRLNHPAIVTVYDAGEDQGLAYIAMEYLRGQHLSHHTDPSRLLPARTVMLLAARVADALHYAHRQNVVHRDIKPANIMYNADTDELKITDFGIARLTDTSRTKTGIVLGTPSFMSPEQLEGRNLDGRSDQFALGVSLFQLLCGHLPFRAESMPRLMQKIATEPHASVRTVRPDLPECIDRILDRALAKPADDRYATCAELALALRECAGGDEKKAPTQSQHEWLIP